MVTILTVMSVWVMLFTGCFLLSALGLSAPIIKIFVKQVDYKIAIDDRYIYRCKSPLNYKKWKILSQHPRSEIQFVAYNSGYTFDKCLSSDGKNVIPGSNITVPPKLYLYCGDVEYDCHRLLSQAEFWWMGKELSDFLNLELQVIYSTPELPTEPSPSPSISSSIQYNTDGGH